MHIERGGAGRGRSGGVRRQCREQRFAGGLDARPEGRMGRDRYGDVQRVVGRGRQKAPFLTFYFSDEFRFTQLDLHNNLDIREPSVHTQTRTWVTDYLVGCHASEESGLSVIVGSNEHVFLPHSSHSSSILTRSTQGVTSRCSGTRTCTTAPRTGL